MTNDDIGFVTPGQAGHRQDRIPSRSRATARIDGQGRRDRPRRNSGRPRKPGLTDPTKGNSQQSLTPTARPTTDLVFRGALTPSARAIEINGRDVPLSPGMTVTVEIKTGSRRILEYLFSPLVETGSKALKER